MRRIGSPGKPLSSLDLNIRCSNSMVGPDFYRKRQQELFSNGDQERINVFDCADVNKRADKIATWNTLLRPGAPFSVEHTEDEVRLLIDGVPALHLFDVPDTPFISAQ